MDFGHVQVAFQFENFKINDDRLAFFSRGVRIMNTQHKSMENCLCNGVESIRNIFTSADSREIEERQEV